MAGKDLYRVLGVDKKASAGRDQEGLPQARAPVPPRPQPGRRAGRGALQGGLGRLRHPGRRRQAQAVRPRDPVRLAGGRAAPEGPVARAASTRPASATSCPTSSAAAVAAAMPPARRLRAAPVPTAAVTSRPRSRSASSRRWTARRSRCRCPRRRPARRATARARGRAPRRRSAPAARAAASSPRARACSRSPSRARAAAARARSSRIPAPPARARAPCAPSRTTA